jgi:hypothetical protein
MPNARSLAEHSVSMSGETWAFTVRTSNGCVAKFFKIRDNARFLEIEKPND